jgi:hypothetical protein
VPRVTWPPQATPGRYSAVSMNVIWKIAQIFFKKAANYFKANLSYRFFLYVAKFDPGAATSLE